ncbi:hypothetical protein CCACVL1_28004 [Corchorus capsularis]|uniref:Uncharacterized protein n=1 Tax=Corchorus capsularis TaxID=210143 RepID=A0A1R3G7X6_COCAP|nr:hypothetical protein CCACVL1_28004 [Corchorus capsularis]
MGHPGTKVLTENLRYLLKNPAARKQMGMEGRKKVERKYLKRHMYKRFVEAYIYIWTGSFSFLWSKESDRRARTSGGVSIQT